MEQPQVVFFTKRIGASTSWDKGEKPKLRDWLLLLLNLSWLVLAVLATIHHQLRWLPIFALTFVMPEVGKAYFRAIRPLPDNTIAGTLENAGIVGDLVATMRSAGRDVRCWVANGGGLHIYRQPVAWGDVERVLVGPPNLDSTFPVKIFVRKESALVRLTFGLLATLFGAVVAIVTCQAMLLAWGVGLGGWRYDTYAGAVSVATYIWLLGDTTVMGLKALPKLREPFDLTAHAAATHPGDDVAVILGQYTAVERCEAGEIVVEDATPIAKATAAKRPDDDLIDPNAEKPIPGPAFAANMVGVNVNDRRALIPAGRLRVAIPTILLVGCVVSAVFACAAVVHHHVAALVWSLPIFVALAAFVASLLNPGRATIGRLAKTMSRGGAETTAEMRWLRRQAAQGVIEPQPDAKHKPVWITADGVYRANGFLRTWAGFESYKIEQDATTYTVVLMIRPGYYSISRTIGIHLFPWLIAYSITAIGLSSVWRSVGWRDDVASVAVLLLLMSASTVYIWAKLGSDMLTDRTKPQYYRVIVSRRVSHERLEGLLLSHLPRANPVAGDTTGAVSL